jgi:hypothetical protein
MNISMIIGLLKEYRFVIKLFLCKLENKMKYTRNIFETDDGN